jgi:hypothetical protein
MFTGWFERGDLWLELGAKARLLHGTWLTRALHKPAGRLPRIPLRRVSEGGFTALMRTVEGRAWAELWWSSAWTRLEEED